MRLIDADNIIKILNIFIENTNNIETYKDYNYSYKRCKKLILDAPTAYDVDKVGEELENCKNYVIRNSVMGIDAISKAIEIVKVGRKNENIFKS